MSDKSDEFLRINAPRVVRAQQQLELVRNSAKSMRIDDDTLNCLLGEFARGRPAPPEPASEPASEPATPPGNAIISQAGVPYADLPTVQLIDKMIALGAILADRRT